MSLTLCKEAKACNFCPFIIIFHCHVYFLLKRSSFHAWAQVFKCPKLSLSLSLSLSSVILPGKVDGQHMVLE
jgi:hypothetical protein